MDTNNLDKWWYGLPENTRPVSYTHLDVYKRQEIDRAIQQCGGVPRTGYRYTAYFHFNRNTEMAKEIYDKIVKELYG